MSIKGVFCAAATPVTEAGNIDTPRFIAHAKNLIADGCNGVALLGTTGEANSFSIAQRKALLEAALAAGIQPAQLLPGTGLCASPETVDLTRHALSLGVTQVVMLPPFYYKNASDEGVFNAYARVFDAVADDQLRVILYHIPQMSAVPISHGLIERLLKSFPKTVVGIKDSAGDFANMQAMLKAFPEFSVLAGADPLMKPLLEAGGHGCITATSNLVGRQLATVFAHHADATKTAEVESAQARIVAVRNISNSFVQIPAIKALVAHRYSDAAWANVQPPLIKLSSEQCADLAKAMNELLAS
jgi:4-hydroxy-tetrahydrodipicolinate synthase